jgi:glycerol uptake operon antiterminator
VEFIQKNTLTDVIISTKPAIIKKSRELGLVTFQRSFIFDSLSLETIKKQPSPPRRLYRGAAAAMPKILRRLCTP